MKAGDDDDLPLDEPVEEPVWEAPQQAPADVAVDDRSRLRMSSDGLESLADHLEELSAQTLAARFVPAPALFHVRRSGGAQDGAASPPCPKLPHHLVPGHAQDALLRDVAVESLGAPIQLGQLGRRHRHLARCPAEALPKALEQVQSLVLAQGFDPAGVVIDEVELLLRGGRYSTIRRPGHAGQVLSRSRRACSTWARASALTTPLRRGTVSRAASAFALATLA